MACSLQGTWKPLSGGRWVMEAGGQALCQGRERKPPKSLRHFVLYMNPPQPLTHNSSKNQTSLSSLRCRPQKLHCVGGTLSSVGDHLSLPQGRPIILCSQDDTESAKFAYRAISLPRTVDCLQGVLSVIPLQLLSFHLAVLRGYDVSGRAPTPAQGGA